MTNEAATIGIEMRTDGLERGIKVLKSLADAGPRVEKAMDGVASAAAKANASMGKVGGDAAGLNAVGKAADDAAKKLGWYRDAQGRMRDESGRFVSVARQVEQGLAGVASQSAQTATGMQSMAVSASSAANTFNLMRAGIQAFIGLQVVGWAKDTSAALYEASAAAERLRIGLDFASTRGSATEIAYLRTTTESLGLAFSDTAKAYMQFQAAAKGTALEGDKARSVFEAISKASAVMGLSADQSAGALMALQQMVSKGTVQAEELRGQLGERLPGAFQIAARSMGVTTAELGKMLEMGQVVADDFLPKFAAELEKSLGDSAERAADRLDAAVNRFDNAWQKLKQTAGDSGVSKAIASEMNAISRDLQAVDDAIASASAQGSGAFSALAQGALVAAGRTGFATLNLAANTLNGTLNLLTGGVLDLRTDLAVLPGVLQSNSEKLGTLQAEAAAAEQNLAHLQSLGAQFGNEVWYQNEITRAKKVAAEYRAALADRLALTGGSGLAGAYTEGMGNSQAITQQRVRFDAAEQFLLSKSADANGVNKKFVEDLKGYADALDAGAISATGYAKAITELNKKRHESTEAGKAEAKALKDSEMGAKGAQSSYDSLLSSVNERIAALKLEASQAGKLTEGQKAQIKLDELLSKGKKGVATAAALQAQAQINVLLGLEKEQKALKRSIDAYQEYLDMQKELADDYVAQSKAREQGRLGVDEYLTGIREGSAALKHEISLMGLSEQAREVALEQYRIELDLKKQIAAVNANAGFDSAQRAEEIARLQAGAAIAMADASSKAFLGNWKTSVSQYDDIFRQGFADMLNEGEDGWKSFTKSLATTFKTTVADQLYKAFAQPFVVNVVGNLLGVTGQGASSGTPSLTGGSGGLMGAASYVQSLYSAFSGGLTTSVATGIGSIGATIGSSMMSNFAAGMIGGAQMAAPVGMGIGSMGATASTGAMGAGAGFAAALPWLAGGLAVVSLASSLIKKETPHAGAASVYSGGAASGNAKSAKDLVNAHSGDYIAEMQQPLNALATTIGGTFDALATKFGKQAGYSVGVGFTSDNNDPSSGYFNLSNAAGEKLDGWSISRKDTKYTSRGKKGYDSDMETGYDEYLKDVAEASLKGIADIVPAWAAGMASSVQQSLGEMSGADALQAFQGVVQQIYAFEAAIDSLGQTMPMFAGLTDDMMSQLMGSVGGSTDALSSVISGFYSAFTSEAEQFEHLSQRLQNAVGIDPRLGDEAAAQFKAAVEQAMAAGNGALAMELMTLAPAFKQATDEAARLSPALSDILRGLKEEEHGLWADLAEAEGDFATAAQRRYWIETEGMTLAEQAAYDYNAAIKAQISSAQAAAAALGSLGATQWDLENQLLGLQGRGTEVEERTRTKELGELLEGVDDEEKRKQITASYDYNASLRKQIEALNAAQQAANSAASAQQSAADAIRSSWQSIGDSIVGEINRIRGLVIGDSSMGLEYYQSQFAITTAQSRAGDQTAASKLAEISQAMLGVAQSGALSMFELQRLRATTASSLEDTLEELSKKFGISVDIPQFAAGGLHSGGLRLVGERGPELEVTGPARYFDTNRTMQMLSGGGGNDALVAEVRALRAEVAALRAANERTASNTSGLPQMVDQFDNVTEGGNAIRGDIVNDKLKVEAA